MYCPPICLREERGTRLHAELGFECHGLPSLKLYRYTQSVDEFFTCGTPATLRNQSPQRRAIAPVGAVTSAVHLHPRAGCWGPHRCYSSRWATYRYRSHPACQDKPHCRDATLLGRVRGSTNRRSQACGLPVGISNLGENVSEKSWQPSQLVELRYRRL